MTDCRRVTFGVKTTPMHVDYDDILRVWQEADATPEIDDAWLWDHMLPLAGPKDGKVYEGWTLLAALAAQTERLRLGLLVTSNRVREPAVLGKIATTVDVISRGRLIMGMGVGGTHQAPGTGGIAGENPAIAEYDAYGLTLVSPAEGIARLEEAVTILRLMWTEEVFNFDGRYYLLKGNRNEPKPVQSGGPPLLIGGWGRKMLRLTAKHANIWNMPGPPHNTAERVAERSQALDVECAALRRDPAEITRSAQMTVSYDDLGQARKAALDLIAAGITHIVLSLPRGYPQNIARRLADEVIIPVRAELPVP